MKREILHYDNIFKCYSLCNITFSIQFRALVDFSYFAINIIKWFYVNFSCSCYFYFFNFLRILILQFDNFFVFFCKNKILHTMKDRNRNQLFLDYCKYSRSNWLFSCIQWFSSKVECSASMVKAHTGKRWLFSLLRSRQWCSFFRKLSLFCLCLKKKNISLDI